MFTLLTYFAFIYFKVAVPTGFVFVLPVLYDLATIARIGTK